MKSPFSNILVQGLFLYIQKLEKELGPGITSARAFVCGVCDMCCVCVCDVCCVMCVYCVCDVCCVSVYVVWCVLSVL